MSTTRAFVIGEALTDIVSGPNGTAEHPGGSPLNVAIGLSRLDIPATLHTRFGRDDRGAAITAHLAESDVALTAQSQTEAPTATALATLDETGAATYTFEITGELAEVAIPTETELVHTGSIAAFLAPGADVIERMLTAAREHALISFDPNARPMITPDRDAVRARTEAIAAIADVIKLSDEDAEWLYPELSQEGVLAHLASFGAGLTAMTRGGEGCLFFANGEHTSFDAPRVSVVDTIGAGDSFMAALLAAILRLDAADAVRAHRLTSDTLALLAQDALTAAAITVSRAGANPPRTAELGR
ncbi:carbohydrate kinase family protein [Mycetocola tolaasinivorans]|nr:carbohydrate kinase [Mycetocola tolaasinivorans]